MSDPPEPTLDVPEHGLTITLRSDPRYLCGVREMIRTLAGRLGFDDDTASKMALAVDEALANVICHGYGRRADQPIRIHIEPIESPAPADTAVGGLTIVIDDEASQVPPHTIKGRPLEEVRPGGLGVHIIRQIMDEVAYEPRQSTGMRLTMTKRRDPTPPSESPEHTP